ncbi:MAG: thioredoxin-disulfide reductase [bacterium]|nr:thioredoxin-disulfide reductase [bacterium]
MTPTDMERVVIIGSGPAGLTAALYAARAMLNPLVFEGTTPGGQLIVSYEVENYPGFPTPLSGPELMQLFRQQAERFGTRYRTEAVERVEHLADHFLITAPSGQVRSRTVIAATGAVARRLDLPAEKRLYGRGISGCATCDGAFFRNKHVLVVGGGNTAMEDALFLTRFASQVTIVHRRHYFRAAPVELQKARNHPKIAWRVPYVIADILGETSVTGAVLRHSETGATETISCDGIFVAIGHDPQTALFKHLVELDPAGYIITQPRSTATRTPGLFACGDVMDPVYKQAVTAAGTGCMAALDAQHYLEALQS